MERLTNGGVEIRALRYNFIDGTARETVRRYSEAELWGNNALIQCLRADPKRLDPAMIRLSPEFYAAYRAQVDPTSAFFERLAESAALAMLAYSRTR